jgi:hypothetical protein
MPSFGLDHPEQKGKIERNILERTVVPLVPPWTRVGAASAAASCCYPALIVNAEF